MPNTPVLVNGATVKISFGTVSQATGGATAVPAAPTVSYTCYAKSFKASIGSQTIDLSTLCSNIDAVFETRKSGTVDIELYIDKDAGPVFRDKVGFLCKILVDLTTVTGGTFTVTEIDDALSQIEIFKKLIGCRLFIKKKKDSNYINFA